MTDNAFEKLLYRRNNLSNSEEFWNKKASDFAKAFAELDKTRDHFLFDTLEQQRVFENVERLVDIGCGVGRHAYYFAKYVKQYVGVDSSEGMLAVARQNKAKYQLDNCQFQLIDWKACTATFDMVFASMCPSINTVEDIKKLLVMAQRYLVIKRYTCSTDSLLDEIDIIGNQAHNNPNYCYGFINILWQLGYIPEVFTNQTITEKTLTFEQAQATYARYLNNLSDTEKAQKVEQLRAIYNKAGNLKSTRKNQFVIMLVDKQIVNRKANIIQV